MQRRWRSWLGVGVVALLAVGCTTTGKGKQTKPAWKVFKDEHPLSVSAEPLRSGAVELRITRAVLVERRTLLEASGWRVRLYGTVTSEERLLLSDLLGAFSVTGASGREHAGHAAPVGPGRATWQHQAHTGEPTFLPAGVAGEFEVVVVVGEGEALDEPVAFSFRGVERALSRQD